MEQRWAQSATCPIKGLLFLFLHVGAQTAADAATSDGALAIRQMDSGLSKDQESFHLSSLCTYNLKKTASCVCSIAAEASALSGPMPFDLCMSFISDCGVLTARNNRKMSKSCYSSLLMCFTIIGITFVQR